MLATDTTHSWGLHSWARTHDPWHITVCHHPSDQVSRSLFTSYQICNPPLTSHRSSGPHTHKPDGLVPRLTCAIMNVPTTYHTTLKHPHQECSGIERLVLEVNARYQHLACKDLCASSGSTADGEDITLRLPRCIPSSNDIEIDATIVQADRRQGGVSTTVNPLRNKGIHLEMSLIKTMC
jgi:hypothetical protein